MDKEEARELLIKSKTYRLFAILFALMGVILFVVLYYNLTKGRFLEVIQNPVYVFLLLLPFVPASFLSWLAVRLEKKLHKFFTDP